MVQFACVVIWDLARHGAQRLVLVIWHCENQRFLTEAIDIALRDLCPYNPLRVMRLEYWGFLTKQTLGSVFLNDCLGFALEHAAVIETSPRLHYHPELVRLNLLPDDGAADVSPYDIYLENPAWVLPTGVLSSARESMRPKTQP